MHMPHPCLTNRISLATSLIPSHPLIFTSGHCDMADEMSTLADIDIPKHSGRLLAPSGAFLTRMFVGVAIS